MILFYQTKILFQIVRLARFARINTLKITVDNVVEHFKSLGFKLKKTKKSKFSSKKKKKHYYNFQIILYYYY